MAQISIGTLPHEKVLRAIELFGTEVAPTVRKEIERRSTSTPEDRQPAKMRRSASSHRRALLQSSLVTF
jgi:hypothetical protein